MVEHSKTRQAEYGGVMTVYFKAKHVKVSKLFCDKLSFTIDYAHKYEHAHIEMAMNELVSSKMANLYRRWPYKQGVSIYLGEYPSQVRMVILWEPRYAGAGYMRVEFNPNYADLEHVYALLTHILPDGFDDVQLKARITRFDASVDLEGISPDELLAYGPGKQISCVHCKSRKTETLELGCKESGNMIVIYNKQLEVKEKNSKKKTALPVPKEPTTRIEINLKPGLNVEGLIHLDNPFQNLVIRPFAALPEVDSQTWRLFVALAQFRGAQDALLMLDEPTRKKFKQKLEAVKCDWWDPAAIWSTWEDLLSEVFVLQPSKAAFAA